jgi:formate hydrogenlyase subunit 6/NADH:ubiquinone oxidoreductase subunit I
MEVQPMAYKITSACVSCGACSDACPAGAISQGDDAYVIDAAACLDCGSCSDTCPNGAIVPEE